MRISRSIDIEDAARQALAPYITAYCRPLPKDFVTPNVLIHQVGGSDTDTIDAFDVVLDSRAKTEAKASEYLRTAIGILKEVAKLQTTQIRNVAVNSSSSWGIDPVRPELAMCSARLRIIAHLENVEV